MGTEGGGQLFSGCYCCVVSAFRPTVVRSSWLLRWPLPVPTRLNFAASAGNEILFSARDAVTRAKDAKIIWLAEIDSKDFLVSALQLVGDLVSGRAVGWCWLALSSKSWRSASCNSPFIPSYLDDERKYVDRRCLYQLQLFARHRTKLMRSFLEHFTVLKRVAGFQKSISEYSYQINLFK